MAPLVAKPFISPAPTQNCTSHPTPAMVSSLPSTVAATAAVATSAEAAAATSAIASTAPSVVTSLTQSAIVTSLNVTSSAVIASQGIARRAVESSVFPTTPSGAMTSPDCSPTHEFTGRFQYAYFISAIPIFLAALFFGLFAWRKRHQLVLDSATKDSENQTSSSSGDEASKASDRHIVGCLRYFFLFVLAIFFLLYVGQEVAFGAFIFSYGVKDRYVLMPTPTAAILTADFWGLFAVGRFLAIPLTWCKVPPGALMTFDLIGSLFAAVLLLVFEQNRHVLWFGCGLMGLSLASVFPSAISWADQYTEINSKAAISFVVGAAIGEMIVPLMMGYLFNRKGLGPRSLMLSSVVIIALAIAFFLVLYMLARGKSLRTLFANQKAMIVNHGRRRRQRKTRRQRNAVLEMTKQGAGGRIGNGGDGADGHHWHSSDSDEVQFEAHTRQPV